MQLRLGTAARANPSPQPLPRAASPSTRDPSAAHPRPRGYAHSAAAAASFRFTASRARSHLPKRRAQRTTHAAALARQRERCMLQQGIVRPSFPFGPAAPEPPRPIQRPEVRRQFRPLATTSSARNGPTMRRQASAASTSFAARLSRSREATYPGLLGTQTEARGRLVHICRSSIALVPEAFGLFRHARRPWTSALSARRLGRSS